MNFSYQSFGNYRFQFVNNSIEYTLSQAVSVPGVLPDNDNDDRFDAAVVSPDVIDPFLFNGMNVPIVYSGEFSFGGNTYPVFTGGAGADFFVFFDDLSEPPATMGNVALTVSPTPYIFCFGPDTHIATPTGTLLVSELAMGDPILTADGATVPVKWIGRQTLTTAFAHPKQRPVCIEAGALGSGLPERDLVVTADHALVFDGLMVTAGALVNGTTIRHMRAADLPQRYTVYHIETEGHHVILAEGQPAETFIDYAARRAFENYAEFEALFPEEATIAELPLPRISTARQVPATLKARLGLDAAHDPAAA